MEAPAGSRRRTGGRYWHNKRPMTPTRRAWRTVQGALLFGLAALLVSACSGSNPFGGTLLGPPLSEIAHDAVNDYQSASAVQIRGSYRTSSSVPVTVQVSVQPSNGQAISGRATYAGAPLDVVGRDGNLFTRGVKYWQTQGAEGLHTWPQYGSGWVLAPSNDPGAEAIGNAGNLGGLLTQLNNHASSLVSEGTSEFQGQEIASLRDGHTVYDVTTSQPYRLLALRRTGASGGLRDLNLQLRYGGKLKVAVPPSGQFVNPRDATTFPAYYLYQSMSDLQSCDQNSCGFSATLVNTTGTEQGQVTATLTLSKDAQGTQVIGSCDTPVPQVGTGQTTTVTCRISGQGYQSYFTSLGGQTTVYRRVSIKDPPYN